MRKTLKPDSKVRQRAGKHFDTYNIVEVEYDQYKLELILEDDINVPSDDKIRIVLSCKQMVDMKFEYDKKDN